MFSVYESDSPLRALDYGVGERVLVTRERGLEPIEAVVLADNRYRPHIVKVQYVRSRAGAWIKRTRIVGGPAS